MAFKNFFEVPGALNDLVINVSMIFMFEFKKYILQRMVGRDSVSFIKYNKIKSSVVFYSTDIYFIIFY